eukprot:Pgem_evm1s9663
MNDVQVNDSPAKIFHHCLGGSNSCDCIFSSSGSSIDCSNDILNKLEISGSKFSPISKMNQGKILFPVSKSKTKQSKVEAVTKARKKPLFTSLENAPELNYLLKKAKAEGIQT